LTAIGVKQKEERTIFGTLSAYNFASDRQVPIAALRKTKKGTKQ
jgi:hypothetical protein